MKLCYKINSMLIKLNCRQFVRSRTNKTLLKLPQVTLWKLLPSRLECCLKQKKSFPSVVVDVSVLEI
ncbi:CLUMA_CG010260, isoform A [Clunio marinus]|uniref:CLUMA_CG010260, isoform A n=1 Tax=Clunio marinus TaxID=568069 RepID=A0A1J1I8F8_9DIPT|nr:CLUMA_CG010260, isoform A [Clunio marinus]